MKKFLLRTTLGVAFVCLIIMIQGCTKISINIGEDGKETSTPGGNNNNNNNGDKALVTFHASVEGRNLTRSVSSLGKNIQVQLFAFNGTAVNAAGDPITTGQYESSVPGLLAGLSGYKMYLTNGIYNFYGVSESLSLSSLTFTNGKSEPLFNGVDYLWWKGAQQDISSPQVSIPIVFLHCSTQVAFEVLAGDGITLDNLVMAHILTPQRGAQMDLSTGIIPPMTSYDPTSLDKMGINGFLAQYIMLPLKTTTPLKVNFSVRVNGETNPRTYNTTVDVPDGELVAGNSYRFKAIINANTVDFPTVSVTNWVDVDETGKPLYPVQ